MVITATILKSVRDHWVMFLVEGIVLVFLGTLAIILSLIARIAVTVLVGWFLLLSGVVGLISTLRTRHAPGFWWSMLSAIIGIVAGGLLLAWPLHGTVSLAGGLVPFPGG